MPPDPTLQTILANLPPPPKCTKMRVEEYVELLNIMASHPSKRKEVMKALTAYKKACDKAGLALHDSLKEVIH
jgi:hypothetical protein